MTPTEHLNLMLTELPGDCARALELAYDQWTYATLHAKLAMMKMETARIVGRYGND